jgi:hypothetical protein
MKCLSKLLMTLCFSMFFLTHPVDAAGQPSSGAQGMAGALGTFSFAPTDQTPGVATWWKDTDGVDPAVAGCHIGTDQAGKANGRMFGEACLPDGILVESNPGAGVVHKHTDDVGHPDKFDCNAYCIGKGSSGGMCEAAPAPPCQQSAKCTCN